MDAMHNTTGAIAQFRAAARANPDEPNVHFGLGYLLWTERQYSEAASEFQAELDRNHEQGRARAYLGDSLVRQNEYAEAEPQLRQAIISDQTFALPYLDLGILDAASGRNEEAVKGIRSAIAREPKDVDSHWRLARVYRPMGETAKANAELAKVCAMKREQDKNPAPKVLYVP